MAPWLLLLAASLATAQVQAPPSPTAAVATASSSPGSTTSSQTSSNLLSYEGLIVREIAMSGLRAGADSKVGALITQVKGQPLEREKIRQTVRNLYSTGRYTDVAAEVERTADSGVKLTFVVQLNYFIGSVRVDGAPDRPTANQIVNVTKFPARPST